MGCGSFSDDGGDLAERCGWRFYMSSKRNVSNYLHQLMGKADVLMLASCTCAV